MDGRFSRLDLHLTDFPLEAFPLVETTWFEEAAKWSSFGQSDLGMDTNLAPTLTALLESVYLLPEYLISFCWPKRGCMTSTICWITEGPDNISHGHVFKNVYQVLMILLFFTYLVTQAFSWNLCTLCNTGKRCAFDLNWLLIEGRGPATLWAGPTLAWVPASLFCRSFCSKIFKKNVAAHILEYKLPFCAVHEPRW